MSCYVVMRGGTHPNAIVIPTPVAVRRTRREANEYIKSRKYPSEYYARHVKDDVGPEEWVK